MRYSFRLILIGWLCLFALPASAMFVPPHLEPVDRLVINAKAYLEKHPQEADAHYTLARIHYLAFSSKQDEIKVFNSEAEGKPAPVPRWMVSRDNNSVTPKGSLSHTTLIEHALLAKAEFEEAIRLDAKNALYQIGLASLLMEVRQWNNATRSVSLPAGLDKISLSDVREAFSKAIALSLPEEEKTKSLGPVGVEDLISYEASSILVKLGEEKQFSGPEEKELQKAKETITTLEKIPMGAITPIVFSFLPTEHLAERLAPETIVDFDLRGYGWQERWTWVKPSLGFLVWDPLHTGKITSARQLFGSYTFQIFRKTGYDALAALDDNGDGFLSGSELRGISVWFDRNSDGISQPAEVTPVEDMAIRSIATSAQVRDGIHPTNPRGLVLSDGRVLPTWDWIVAPVRAESPLALAGTTSVK